MAKGARQTYAENKAWKKKVLDMNRAEAKAKDTANFKSGKRACITYVDGHSKNGRSVARSKGTCALQTAKKCHGGRMKKAATKATKFYATRACPAAIGAHEEVRAKEEEILAGGRAAATGEAKDLTNFPGLAVEEVEGSVRFDSTTLTAGQVTADMLVTFAKVFAQSLPDTTLEDVRAWAMKGSLQVFALLERGARSKTGGGRGKPIITTPRVTFTARTTTRAPRNSFFTVGYKVKASKGEGDRIVQTIERDGKFGSKFSRAMLAKLGEAWTGVTSIRLEQATLHNLLKEEESEKGETGEEAEAIVVPCKSACGSGNFCNMGTCRGKLNAGTTTSLGAGACKSGKIGSLGVKNAGTVCQQCFNHDGTCGGGNYCNVGTCNKKLGNGGVTTLGARACTSGIHDAGACRQCASNGHCPPKGGHDASKCWENGKHDGDCCALHSAGSCTSGTSIEWRSSICWTGGHKKYYRYYCKPKQFCGEWTCRGKLNNGQTTAYGAASCKSGKIGSLGVKNAGTVCQQCFNHDSTCGSGNFCNAGTCRGKLTTSLRAGACTCSHGHPATGADCPAGGGEKCVSCAKPVSTVQDGRCKPCEKNHRKINEHTCAKLSDNCCSWWDSTCCKWNREKNERCYSKKWGWGHTKCPRNADSRCSRGWKC
jgi:hypothetical protein